MKRFIRNNFPWLLWGLFILVLVCIPKDKMPEVPEFISLFEPDKLIHIFLFSVFTWLMIHGLKKQESYFNSFQSLVFLVLLTGTLYSGGTELLQHYLVPGRIASLPDFIANEAGCFMGWGIFIYWQRKRKKR